MASTARGLHISAINALLVKHGANLDRYGTYRIGDYKFDTRAVNLKIHHGKIKIKSTPMMKITLESLDKLLKIYAMKENESKWADTINFSKK